MLLPTNKALNPKTLGRFFGLWSPTFWDESLFLKMCYGARIASQFNAGGILAITYLDFHVDKK